MKKICGLAAFGLDDTVSFPKGSCRKTGFFLADVVLPQNPLDPLLTGQEAKKDRVHVGLAWPKETRIVLGDPLRRVPVPCAWALLVAAGDSPIRWESPTGSFPLATILAEHVRTVVGDTENASLNADEMVVTIPDHLDEYGQTALLRELRHRMTVEVRLLWRPVAAALAWLDAVQDDLGPVTAKDWLAVVYLGADGIECTGVRLQPRVHAGKRYILPVRERPVDAPGFSGSDWAVDIMESRLGLGSDDPGAFWQVFTVFPEVWQALAGLPWEASKLPRAWSKDKAWYEWAPSPDLRRNLSRISIRGGKTLWELLRPSCSVVRATPRGSGQTWGKYLQEKISQLLQRQAGGRLRGVIVCGPLAPREQASWLAGFGMQTSCLPEPDALWLAAGQDDPVALGGRIYGERLDLKLPTYLDTLPQIATIVIDNYVYRNVSLVEATTCEGGKSYTNSVNGKFKLQKECPWVEFYLKRVEHEGPTAQDSHSKHARYRKGKMRFPSAPDRDTVIDLKVEMRPANGLAQVELVPRQKEFLRGRKVFFDYSHMENADELPVLKRGWPEIVKMQVTHDPTVLTQQNDIQRFLDTAITDPNYTTILQNAKIAWSTPKTVRRDGTSVRLMKIDQDGQAGSAAGQAVVAKLRNRLEEHFNQLHSQGILSGYRDKIITMGTWLWGRTPSAITQCLDEYFKPEYSYSSPHWSYFVEAASRCFKEERQYKILFNSIYYRLVKKQSFPINAARGVYRILIYRENSYVALNQHQADAFLGQALEKIDSEIDLKNIKRTFFQGVLLFFVLLRYRKINSNFMNPDEPRYADLFDHLRKSLGRAKDCTQLLPGNAAGRIEKLVEEIMRYVHFEGTPGIIQALLEQAEN